MCADIFFLSSFSVACTTNYEYANKVSFVLLNIIVISWKESCYILCHPMLPSFFLEIMSLMWIRSRGIETMYVSYNFTFYLFCIV
ncbi:hypothetical protein IFM89_024736 [Coptis chinensis]|uniref:Uncharacterized protein n=1 Tax=Coptis chinensis TaxID=261450 RepID=A0A835H8M6_9MAGN|nr:hypothetical protein IFM89_024736 [Coptis chinensis]